MVSSVNFHTSRILEFVDYCWQPEVTQLKSYVKDTAGVIKKIEVVVNVVLHRFEIPLAPICNLCPKLKSICPDLKFLKLPICNPSCHDSKCLKPAPICNPLIAPFCNPENVFPLRFFPFWN